MRETDKTKLKRKLKKSQPLTAVCSNWGFRLNLKMVLYLENLCLMEKTRLFIPQLLQAAKRYASFYKTNS